MLKEFVHNIVFVAVAAVAAGVGGSMAGAVVTGRGALGPLVLAAEHPIKAILALIVALVVALAAALVIGRLMNAVYGMFVLGGGLFGVAFRFGTVDELARLGDFGLMHAAIECAIWGLVVLGLTQVVFRVVGRLPDISHVDERSAFRSAAGWRMAAAGLVVLPVVYFVAATDAKGQALGAVFLGAVAVGLVGRLISPAVQPRVLYAAPIFAGAIGYFVASFMLGQTPLVEAVARGSIAPLGRPMPIDYVASSLMGVSIGLGWARSFVHHDAEDEAPVPARAS